VWATNLLGDRAGRHAIGLGAYEEAENLKPRRLAQGGECGQSMGCRHPVPGGGRPNVADNC
jgi:hypothetical protein